MLQSIGVKNVSNLVLVTWKSFARYMKFELDKMCHALKWRVIYQIYASSAIYLRNMLHKYAYFSHNFTLKSINFQSYKGNYPNYFHKINTNWMKWKMIRWNVSWLDETKGN